MRGVGNEAGLHGCSSTLTTGRMSSFREEVMRAECGPDRVEVGDDPHQRLVCVL